MASDEVLKDFYAAEVERLAGQVAALREALAGMLESYEFCLGDELALSDLTKDVMRGAFVGEAARARAALAACPFSTSPRSTVTRSTACTAASTLCAARARWAERDGQPAARARRATMPASDAARLVDELTTLLYEVRTGWQDSAGGHQIVRCGACRRHADRAESVVHDSACPVYRLQRTEDGITAVIRANADEIADLEDVRDDLEAKVNALTAELVETKSLLRDRSPLFQDYEDSKAENERLAGQVAALREAGQRVIDCIDPPLFFSPEALRASLDVAALRLALAATGGEGQG